MKEKPIKIPRYIQLLVKEPLDKKQAGAWLASAKAMAPSGVLATVQTTDEQGALKGVSMVHKEGKKKHGYLIPLTRDLLPDEVQKIVDDFVAREPNLDFDIDNANPNHYNANMNYIYVLRDPRSNAIRYLGVTNNLKRRFRCHCFDGREHGPLFRKACWIRQLLRLGLKPIMQTIFSWNDGEISKNGRQEIEKQWIADLRAIGHDLTNTTIGGDGFDSEDLKKFAKLAGVEERKRRAQKAVKTLGAAGIAARMKKMIDVLGPEGLLARAKRSIETQGVVGLKERSIKGLSTLGADGLKKRGERISAGRQLKSGEERSEQLYRSHQSRRAKIYGPLLPIGISYDKRDKLYSSRIPMSETGNDSIYLGQHKRLNDAINAQMYYRKGIKNV